MARPINVRRRPSRPGRGRVIAVAAVGILLLILVSARGVARVYTDFLWFDSLEFSRIWRGLLWARVGLVVVFFVAFFLLLWVNLVIAHRLAPPLRPPGPEEEALEPVYALIGRRWGLVRIVVAALLALIFGTAVSGRWGDWLLFRNHVPFGVEDAQFGHDVGFYVFQLPFLTLVTDWLFAAVAVTALVTAGAHYLHGGIRLQVPGRRVTPAVQAHLSVLFAILAFIKGANYYLDRFDLLYSGRGVVRGASYTDVNAQLPAINLLLFISALAGILFIANVFRRGWALPLIALGLWSLVAVVAAGIYPALVQRFRVEPAESTREAPFIERNIAATRTAMNLDDVTIRSFAYDEQLSGEALVNNADTIRNVRLWDPRVLRRTYQRLQEVRTFYRFTDVDVDRYQVGDTRSQIVLSARELNPDSLPSDTWENRHLAFTHGYGAVLSPANAVTLDGQPDFIVKNIPPQGEPKIDQPRLYHGEGLGGFAIVNTGRDEIDYLQDDGTAVTNRYDGTGGVGAGTVTRRLAFALRFGDINPLISGFMTSDSRILYLRDIRDRVEALAPFLHFDHDPYPVVLEGRITWVIDGYTTTNRFPYAQKADTDRLPSASGLNHSFNYVRNSVKATVDAYDGSVNFYVIDEDDPVITAYSRAFPGLFTEASEIPDDLREHFRYPEDLFRVQTNMWGRYHIEEAGEFYSQSDRWNIAQDPDSTLTDVAPQTTAAGGGTTTRREGRMDPYYLLMRLPQAPAAEFLILQPFVPFSDDDTRRELSAFMVAKSDPGEYGELEVFVMPRDRQVDGPAIVNARINQAPEVSQLITLLSRAGSEVLLGNLVIIPVEQSLIYVRPLYVQATGANAVPELKKVIVAFGDRISIQDTLQAALTEVFGAAPETLEEGVGEPPPGGEGEGEGEGEPVLDVAAEVRRLLERAATLFSEADTALRNGDPVEYARKIEAARRAFEDARRASQPDDTAPAPEGEGEPAADGGGEPAEGSAAPRPPPSGRGP